MELIGGGLGLLLAIIIAAAFTAFVAALMVSVYGWTRRRMRKVLRLDS